MPPPTVPAPRPQAAPPPTHPRRAPETVPPAPGTYDYSLTEDGRASSAELTVVAAAARGGELRQDQTWATPDGTETSGFGWSSRAEQMAWSEPDGTTSCSYAPEVVWLQLPLAAGAHWQGQSSCSYEADGAPVRVVQSTAARVVTAASTSVGGGRVFCWVIERDVVTTAATGGTTATSETRTTDLFAPAWGLVVYETGKSAAPRADGTVQNNTWTAKLQD